MMEARMGREPPTLFTWCRLCSEHFAIEDHLHVICPNCGAEQSSPARRILVFEETYPPDDGNPIEVLVEQWPTGQVKVALRPKRGSWGPPLKLVRTELG